MALTLGPSLHEGHDGQLTSVPSRVPRDPSYPDTALCAPTIREGKAQTRKRSALKKAVGGSSLGPEPTAPVHVQGTSSLACPSLPTPPASSPSLCLGRTWGPFPRLYCSSAFGSSANALTLKSRPLSDTWWHQHSSSTSATSLCSMGIPVF